MEQSRVEFFLDEGWNLIGRLHQWLARWPLAVNDRDTMIELVRDLQQLWASADDLGVKRLAKTSLALEQLLERFCGQTLEFTSERLHAITAGIGCLQELMLGLEATREEPTWVNLAAVAQLECHAGHAIWCPPEETFDGVPENILEMPQVSFESATVIDEDATAAVSDSFVSTTSETVANNDSCQSVDRTLLAMLEEFVVKLDDTCHVLHVKMIADASPYVSTTSRLEHLSRATRELVDEITQELPEFDLAATAEHLEILQSPLTEAEFHQVLRIDDIGHPSSTPDETSDMSAVPESFASLNAEPILETLDTTPALLTLDNLPSLAEEVVTETQTKPRRILIVEESLFYRQLIGMAVQSAGFEPLLIDSAGNGLEFLQQSPDVSAIVIGSFVSQEMTDAIEQHRQTHGAKVVGMVSSEKEGQGSVNVDESVLRSNPRQLIASLNRVLDVTSDQIRMSA